MADDSNFGMRSMRDDSTVEYFALDGVSVSARVCRTSTPAAVGGVPRLGVPRASRVPVVGRQNAITAIREEVEITNPVAMFIPERLLPIVKGLSLGKPDVTVSRLLEMSPRTFSRKVAELLAYLEVETRFQAGAEVAYRWLTDPRIH